MEYESQTTTPHDSNYFTKSNYAPLTRAGYRVPKYSALEDTGYKPPYMDSRRGY